MCTPPPAPKRLIYIFNQQLLNRSAKATHSAFRSKPAARWAESKLPY